MTSQLIGLQLVNSSLRKLYDVSLVCANGYAELTKTQLNVTDVTDYYWFITMVYTPGKAMVYPTIQFNYSETLYVYLRYDAGQQPPDNTYRAILLREPK
jgi:hypothetical protein